MIAFAHRRYARVRSEAGFTMIVTIGVMLVSGLLLVAAFAAANGDVHLSRNDTMQKKAYFAALAGVQEYEYQLQNNPSYWLKCEQPTGTEGDQRYEITLLGANGSKTCSASNPFATAIESTGAVANTFRIKAVGCAGKAELTSCVGQPLSTVSTRSVIATFQVTGFLNYTYFTQYEDLDPYLSGKSKSECERYDEEGGSTRSSGCVNITFSKEDSVNGPMHTDDTAQVECSSELEFGRKGHKPPDPVEMNGGTSSCGGSHPTYNTASGEPTTTGPELSAPESDSTLERYVKPENEFTGATHIILNGSEYTAKYFKEVGGVLKEVEETGLSWPSNGLIYVQKNSKLGCSYTFAENGSNEADSTKGKEKERGCGNVTVSGTYSKPLTIAGENEVIVNGSLTPTGVTPGSAPTGSATLGLIATYFVRVYHPCNGSGDGSESLKNPWIYAAMLSTSHSFIVDNYACGENSNTGTLNVYGAIAQKFRGPVGTGGGGGISTGYAKEYLYDDRLAVDEPPFFIAPLRAGWKIVRETAPNPG
jgi:hypothetical protein